MALERHHIVKPIAVKFVKPAIVVDRVPFVDHALRVLGSPMDVLPEAAFTTTVLVMVPQLASRVIAKRDAEAAAEI